MSEIVKITIKNHVAHVILNRPEKYNSVTPDMFQAIGEAARSLSSNKEVRAVVLSGEGKAFCAGIDFEFFKKMESDTVGGDDLLERPDGNIANLAQYAAHGWKQLPVPVIAAVHGVAFGAGCQIALGADIRFASHDAKFSVMEMKWGLIPDMSASQTLRDLVRIDIAKQLLFTGKILGAEEAARLGLVTQLCEDPLAEAFTLADEIAGKNPHAVRASKKLLNETWHGEEKNGLVLETDLVMSLIGSPNQVEAIQANFENRKPRFEDVDE
ncbi:crotonase/enoyl-CoA hydratase family protein [Thermodesulfobacteriota bacterium]